MEVKKLDLPEVQFPELWSYDSEKKKISLVGKMRTRHRTRMQVFYTPLFTGCMDLIAAKKVRDAAAEGSYDDGVWVSCSLLHNLVTVAQEMSTNQIASDFFDLVTVSKEMSCLVKRGADVKKADLKGRTPLHFAACRGDCSIVQLLIDNGASVNVRDCNGSTPLHLACCTSHIDVITTLLRAGTIVDAVDDRGITPLRLAHSRLRVARDCDHDGELPFTKKTDVCKIVEMLKEFLVATQGSKDETTELEELASKLSLSETHQQVSEVHSLLEGFTSLSIQRRELEKEHQC